MDRRVDSRLDVRLPCYVGLPNNHARRLAGVTVNVSRSGMLVSWRRNGPAGELPAPGDVMTAEIELPASRSFGRRCMHCQVTVVRIREDDADAARVAFRVNRMQFRNYATGRFARGGLEDVLNRSRLVM